MNKKPTYDLNDPEILSALEELSLWSAPFGMKLLDNIRYKKGIRALNIGFGTGFPLIEIAKRLGNSSVVYGLDPWKAAIEKCRQKIKTTGLSNIKLYEGVAEEMPFENDYFDLITSNNGLNNVQDLKRSLSECGRVAKTGAQFVFTYNTAKSFIEFYDVFRKVINKSGLGELNETIDDHIYSKRKPMELYKQELQYAGFEIESVVEDVFYYRFADGTSFLNHFFIKLAFLESWLEIVPERFRSVVFNDIENKLNNMSAESDGFKTQVTYYAVCCIKNE
jgi:arsenite methyltransferase